jgi:hypothetical protein
LEFLEEWGTENFEVCFLSLSVYLHAFWLCLYCTKS